MTLQILPTAIFYLIVKEINDPKTFKNVSISCKLFNNICNDTKVQKNAKDRMKKKINCEGTIPTIYHLKFKEEYFILPNGTKHGECKVWYKNGQLMLHCFYQDNKYEGEYKTWWENGFLWQDCLFENGLSEGEYKQWHDNGQLHKHCFYLNDKMSGEYKSWHPNGQPYEHCFYKNKREGEGKTWDYYGQLRELCFYKNSKKIEIKMTT